MRRFISSALIGLCCLWIVGVIELNMCNIISLSELVIYEAPALIMVYIGIMIGGKKK